MANDIKKYLDKMDNLPNSLTKSNKEMRELDQKVFDAMREIKVKTYSMINNLRKCSRESRVKTYKEIVARYEEARKMQMEKIELSRIAYDLVDDQIKEMDKQSNQYVEKQKQKYEESDRLSQFGSDNEGRKRKNTAGRKDKKKGDGKQARMSHHVAALDNFNPMPIVVPVDMPVDPNEPTYCICHQVSFGEMVGCDNPDCKTEWFHFQCVGLTQPPPGKWYCAECTALRKRK